jgi:hypothetical protein
LATQGKPTINTTTTLPTMPYNIYLSEDPFDDHIQILVSVFSTHKSTQYPDQALETKNKARRLHAS